MENIKKISEEEKNGLKNCSVLNSPSNPSASGYSAVQIKKLMVNPIVDGQTNLVDIINGIIDDANSKIEQAFIDNALEREALIGEAVELAGTNADAKDIIVEKKANTYTDTEIYKVNKTYELEEELFSQNARLNNLETKKHAKDISISLNQNTGVLEIQLLDDDGNTLGEKQSVDFPLEMLIESASYNASTKQIKLVFKDTSRTPITINVSDLVDTYTGETNWVNVSNNVIKIADGIKSKINQAHSHANKDILDSLTDVETVSVNEVEFALAAEQGNPNPITSGAVYREMLSKATIKRTEIPFASGNTITLDKNWFSINYQSGHQQTELPFLKGNAFFELILNQPNPKEKLIHPQPSWWGATAGESVIFSGNSADLRMQLHPIVASSSDENDSLAIGEIILPNSYAINEGNTHNQVYFDLKFIFNATLTKLRGRLLSAKMIGFNPDDNNAHIEEDILETISFEVINSLSTLTITEIT